MMDDKRSKEAGWKYGGSGPQFPNYFLYGELE